MADTRSFETRAGLAMAHNEADERLVAMIAAAGCRRWVFVLSDEQGAFDDVRWVCRGGAMPRGRCHERLGCIGACHEAPLRLLMLQDVRVLASTFPCSTTRVPF